MSESDNSNSSKIDSSNSDSKIIRSQVKKYRLKRKGKLLEISPTEEELNYRKNFNKFNVLTDFPNLVQCTKCEASFKNDILKGKKIYSHPLLKVLMCKSCCTFFGDGEFSLDEDGEDKYCRWCGEGGKLFLCSKCICGFCPKCIKKHFDMKKVIEIKKDDDWICYICNPEPLWKLRNVCYLAQKQSKANKNQNNEDFLETSRETANRMDLCGNKSKEVVEPSKDKEDDPEQDTHNGGESKRRRSRRHRKCLEQSKTKDNISSCSIQSCDDDEPPTPKKRRIMGRKKDASSRINNDGRNKPTVHKNLYTTSEESSSSDSDVSFTENQENKCKVKENEKVQKNKHAEKLKEIVKIAQITSELCSQLCKKELRKLDKKKCVVPDEKLMSDCEKIKSMIILMSSSLSTSHNMIISLQQKFGTKGLDTGFHGNGDTSLLKMITHILMKKRVKTSHLVSVVNDILNRYPCIALESKRISDSVWDNMTKSVNYNDDDNSINLKDNVIPDGNVGVVERKNNDSLRSRDSSGKSDSVFATEISQKNVASSEKPCCDSDTSTDIFESDNRFTEASDNRTEKGASVNRDNSMNGGQLKKDSPSDFDMDVKKIYENSLRLKEQLLKDSTDETSPNDVELSDSSATDDNRDGRTIKKRNLKDRGRTKRNQMSEEREIRRLTNLRSLERRIKSDDSDSETSSEESGGNEQQIVRKNKEASEEESNSDIISLKSECDKPSTEGTQFPGHQDEINFIKQCSSLLRDYILKSTSSESGVEEEMEYMRKSKKMKYRSKIKTGRYSTADVDIRQSTTCKSSDDQECEKSKTSESSDGDSTDIFEPSKLKRNQKSKKFFISTDSDNSDVIQENSPKGQSPGKGRKMIRKILKNGNLELGTQQAIKVENERKKRIAERNECYKKFFPNLAESERLVLDFDRETGEVLLEVPKVIVKNLKPHQKEGVKFMWDNCFESLASLEENNGSGCILAHCMGLGKTLQIVTLIATVMINNLGVDTVLILCPLNVVNNWLHEFNLWLKDIDFNIDIYNIVSYKKSYERYYKIKQWHTEGGILILSYDMMRNLTNADRKRRSQTESYSNLSEFLLDPGPNLVVCDEGHVIKNEDTTLAKCMRRIRTARRIILTGTPFQNNLLEYHSMVQFIKPNILGTRKEFMNRFANPIRNGQFEDSTTRDVKLMRARAHVLHKLLDGCIQRFSYSVLTPFLPEKHEYVISIRLTETQAKLYQYYADKCKKIAIKDKGTKLFSDFHWLQKIWTHPRVVSVHTRESPTVNGHEGENESSTDESVICIEPDASDEAYWKQIIKPEECEDIYSSGKLLVLFDILHHCGKLGDKVLVFSQSLKNLNLIEYFLHKVHLANKSKKKGNASEGIPPEYLDTWVEGEDYFRMDGSTASVRRTKWCKWFNSEEHTRARLFLISTKAGGLGINLVGANRVIMFDASWNPSHDVQSIFRVYRFGQSKICYIYRLVAEATMEEKIYERQVTKLSLEKRVLDEHQIERHYTMGNLQDLYKYDPLPKDKWTVPMVPKDMILAETLKVRRGLIVAYHEHDSLLENKEDEEMTEEERKAAWEDFEKERFMIENKLERKTFATPKDAQSIDKLTKEVLRVTGMYRASGSDFPHFNPLPTLSPQNNLPFKVVNIHSLDMNFSQASASQNNNSQNIP